MEDWINIEKKYQYLCSDNLTLRIAMIDKNSVDPARLTRMSIRRASVSAP